MSIKYTCADCGSVMTIKDEKAGTRAKCPKCKVAFVVPLQFESGGADSDVNSDEDTESDLSTSSAEHKSRPKAHPHLAAAPSGVRAKAVSEPDDDDEHGLDLPLDLTPGSPSIAAHSPEAPARVTRKKERKSKTTSSATAASAASSARKASVADLMRGFEAGPSGSSSTATPVRESFTVSETTGTAADALARAYQQKKDNASNPRQKEKPGSEERQLMMEWLAKVVPAVLGILVLSYGLYWLINGPSYQGPPLAYVAGRLTQGGTPLVGYQVRFVPVFSNEELNSSGEEGSTVPRSTSSGVTNEKGQFVLMYSSDYEGSCTGEHTVEILNPSGIPVFVPDGYLNQTVSEDGIPELVMDLN